ncbi:hypothetical protein [Aliivibrio logei]|uniref:Uncharacterized protein n=1 Tax=Aliivibrio logei 5S-186 TaxID=626086 RepID=A0ABX3AUG8_ALILO|nr:hypothetical protein [Aliivibrio logei]OEF12855.1 hypothetical protein A1Q5_08625 [Aliivibrio logei 5S-186]
MTPEFIYDVPEYLGLTGKATAEREAQELYVELLQKGVNNMTEIKIQITNMEVIASWVIDGKRYFYN